MNMHANTQVHSERGQVMVVLVLAIVILLGFSALAIDGGMVYSDRRIAQNAADAAALAGAGDAGQLLKETLLSDWDCGAGFNSAISHARDAAVASASENDFTITRTLGITENVVTVTCNSSTNPTDNYLDVRVRIDTQTPTTFAHLFFSGELKNTVEGTSRVTPRMPFAGKNAIVSLTDNCGSHFDKGIVFGGNGNTQIHGGNIHSNSCLTLNGASGVITITNGIAEYDAGETYTNNGGMDISPAPATSLEDVIIDPIVQYCASTPNAPNSGNPNILLPGTYQSMISVNNNKTKIMRSGLYCLRNGIRVNGGGTLLSEVTEGASEGGVTIVILNGNFDAAGNAVVKLKAPPPDCDATPDAYNLTCPTAIPGMLIYLPPGNNNRVSVTGTSDSEYTGTIYAPDGYIDVGGTSSALEDVYAQMIAHSVLIHGDTTLNIHYDDNLTFNLPARLNMQR
jgi:hypothetical protein